MTDWDDNSPRLVKNLKSLLGTLRDQAVDRVPIASHDTKAWHSKIMAGLEAPNPDYIGRVRKPLNYV